MKTSHLRQRLRLIVSHTSVLQILRYIGPAIHRLSWAFNFILYRLTLLIIQDLFGNKLVRSPLRSSFPATFFSSIYFVYTYFYSTHKPTLPYNNVPNHSPNLFVKACKLTISQILKPNLANHFVFLILIRKRLIGKAV